jgi:cyanophycinase
MPLRARFVVPSLVFLSMLGCAGSRGASAPAAAGGTLFIVGGGSQPRELVTQFVALAGGPGRARIAVVPMASEEAEAGGREKAEQLREFGADAFVFNISREEADVDSVVRRLDSVTGIWFGGGDQMRLAPILRGTAALRAMHERYRSGAVVGGTSAGAAIMSDSMITGNQFRPGEDTSGYYDGGYRQIDRRTIEIVPGLGFLPSAIVDQHFVRRQRHNRLVSAVLERPALIGVGIDEGTAVQVDPDGRWTILGASAAVIYDARNAKITAPAASRLGAAGVHFHLLPAGSTFDPRTGRATLPGG